ncbi:MAG: lipoprotein [Proteobacteria bacterium]|nr:lipoprotein [Pseudomonadota bacterium]
MRYLYLFILSLMLVFLSACGQKGPLYLPSAELDTQKNEQQQ